MDIASTATFERIYRDHRRSVFLAALRITQDPVAADDVTHDVFMRLWRKPAKFDASRGDLLPYLRLMARSRHRSSARERQAAGRATDRLTAVVERAEPADSADPVPSIIAEERAQAVREALDCLPQPQREAVVLAYWGGLTAEEISQRIDAPLGTVKSRLRLGLAKLRPVMTESAPLLEAA